MHGTLAKLQIEPGLRGRPSRETASLDDTVHVEVVSQGVEYIKRAAGLGRGVHRVLSIIEAERLIGSAIGIAVSPTRRSRWG